MADDQRASGTVDTQRRRILAAAAGGVTLSALGTGATGGAAAVDDDTLTIIHDTHFHGRFNDSDFENLDIARYQTLVDDLRDEYPNALFFGNGDDLAPSVLGIEFEGEHMIEAMNEMDIDAVGAGNHEFDFGVEVAEERFEESTFPWVVANLLTPDGDPVPGTERWTTVETDDHTVGVFGLGVRGFHDITDYPDDWQVLDYDEASEEAVAALEDEGADFIVCASHISTGNHPEVANVEGVDAVVGSHSGVVFDEPDTDEDGLISEFGDEFDHLGRLTFDVDSGELVDWERLDLYDSEALDEEEYPEETDNITPVDVQDVERHEALAEVVDEYNEELDERLGEPVVESEVELNASFDNYAIETGWGNLMMDLTREVGDLDEEIDVAFQNGGGIRSDATYGPGEITGADVMNILPFPNEIEVWEVTGAQLRTYLEEDAIRPMPGGRGAQPAIQTSGISFEWIGHDGEAEADRIHVGGEPLDDEETYLVATNDFEAGRTTLSEGELVLQSGQFQGPYTMDKLDDLDTIAPEREHRMIRVDERVGDVEAVEANDDTLTLTVPNTEASGGAIEDTFRVVVPGGDVVELDLAGEDSDTIELTGAGDAIEALFEGSGMDELAVYGGFDPDDAYYGYESDDDDEEYRAMPVNDMYDHAKLRAVLSASAVEDALAAVEEPADDDEPHDDDGEDDDVATPDDTGEGDTADEAPGFGPVAGAAGVAGGAYLYSRFAGSEGDDAGDE